MNTLRQIAEPLAIALVSVFAVAWLWILDALDQPPKACTCAFPRPVAGGCGVCAAFAEGGR